MHRRSKTTACNWAYGSAGGDSSSSSAAGPCSPGRLGSWAPLPTQTAGSAGSCQGDGTRLPPQKNLLGLGWWHLPSWLASPAQPLPPFTAQPGSVDPTPCSSSLFIRPSVFAARLCVCWGHWKKGSAGSPRSAGRKKGVPSRGVPIPLSTALGHPWHPVQGQMVPGPEGKLEGLYPCTLIISL